MANSELGDQQPVIACENGDSICADCFTKLQAEHDAKCPTCEGELQKKLTVNKRLLDMLRNVMECPGIAGNEMDVEKKPFAEGIYGKIYDAKWHDRNVVVKVIVSHAEIDKHIKELKYEANIATGLFHPNVIRLFGTTWIQDENFGIVMEKAQLGSLDKWIGKMNQENTANIALGITDGLDYVHSEGVVHSNLRPQNIMLFRQQDDMIPKIADCGVSKVIRSATMQTTAGTPLYMAPEVRSLCPYGSSADIFSLAMMLLESIIAKESSKHRKWQASILQFQCRR